MIDELIVLLCTLSSVTGKSMMWDRFELTETTGVLESNLRVHKINRTTAALFGNLSITLPLTSDFKGTVYTFHSPLGNNQFYKYPMKIGPVDVCDFTKNYMPDYVEYYDKYIVNNIQNDECPVLARKAVVNDLILDGSMLPPYVPNGFWRVEISIADSNGNAAVVNIFSKVYDKGYF